MSREAGKAPSVDYQTMERDALLGHLHAVQEALAERVGGPEASHRRDVQAQQRELEKQNRALRDSHQALEEARARWAHLFECAPVAYLSLTRDAQIRESNVAAAELLGVSCRSLLGGSLTDWLPPSDSSALTAHLGRAAGDAGRVVTELTLRGPDGDWREVRMESRSSRTQGETLFLCTVIDVTESRRAQAEIARLNADARRRIDALEALFELVPVGIVVIDGPESAVRANGTAMRLLGVDGHGAGGYRATRNGTDLESPLAPLYTVARSGEDLNDLEFEIAQGDARRAVLTSARPLFDAQGAPTGAVATFADITQRREAERALRDSERALRQRSEQLHEADRRKNEFLAVLGHELRNPLAPLRNSVQVCLLRHPGDPKLARPLAIMDRQVTHLTRLVDDLLDVSRISSGQITLHREPVSLAQVMHHAEELARPLMEERGHRLEVLLPPAAVAVEGDATRLVQALGNLLNNAARYTPQGGYVGMQGSESGDMAVVRIADDGAGIEPDAMQTIFDPFVQLDGGVSGVAGGLGVGLTLVRSIVELHGGDVQASSDGPGRGSVFTVRLPRVQTRMAPPEEAPARARAMGAQRILVVDDQAVVAESFAELLRSLGHAVEVAHEGESALRVAAEWHPRVAFIDIGMPGMHGCELARRLRLAYGAAMALVAVTGYGGEVVKGLPGHEAFDRHLLKPVPLDEVLRVLEALAPAQDVAD